MMYIVYSVPYTVYYHANKTHLDNKLPLRPHHHTIPTFADQRNRFSLSFLDLCVAIKIKISKGQIENKEVVMWVVW